MANPWRARCLEENSPPRVPDAISECQRAGVQCACIEENHPSPSSPGITSCHAWRRNPAIDTVRYSLYSRICHYRFGKKGRKTGWRTGGVWSLRSPDQTAFSREAPPVLLSSQCTVNLGRATLIGQQLLAKECLAPCLCTLHLPLHSSWTTPPLAPRKSRPPNNYSLNTITQKV